MREGGREDEGDERGRDGGRGGRREGWRVIRKEGAREDKEGTANIKYDSRAASAGLKL